MQKRDYKRFLNVPRKHECLVPFHAFPLRPAPRRRTAGGRRPPRGVIDLPGCDERRRCIDRGRCSRMWSTTLADLVQGAGYEVVTRLTVEERPQGASPPIRPTSSSPTMRLGTVQRACSSPCWMRATRLRRARSSMPLGLRRSDAAPRSGALPRHPISPSRCSLCKNCSCALAGLSRAPRPWGPPANASTERRARTRTPGRLPYCSRAARLVRAAAPDAAFVPVIERSTAIGCVDGDDRAELLGPPKPASDACTVTREAAGTVRVSVSGGSPPHDRSHRAHCASWFPGWRAG